MVLTPCYSTPFCILQRLRLLSLNHFFEAVKEMIVKGSGDNLCDVFAKYSLLALDPDHLNGRLISLNNCLMDVED